jgi:hypothetical protein
MSFQPSVIRCRFWLSIQLLSAFSRALSCVDWGCTMDSRDATFLGLRDLPREVAAFEVEVFFKFSAEEVRKTRLRE